MRCADVKFGTFGFSDSFNTNNTHVRDIAQSKTGLFIFKERKIGSVADFL